MKNNNMAIQQILIIILVGLAAGVLSGLVGVGGGIIIVPALVYFLGFSQHEAQGTSLGILLNDQEIIHASGKVRVDRIDYKGIIHSESLKHTHRLKTIRRYF